MEPPNGDDIFGIIFETIWEMARGDPGPLSGQHRFLMGAGTNWRNR
jgi:hypothetical protein